MLLTHIDIEVFVDGSKKLQLDPFKCPKDFIDFLTDGTDFILYGLNENTPVDWATILMKVLDGRGSNANSEVRPDGFSTDQHIINYKNPYQIFFLYTKDKEEQFRLTKEIGFLVGFINDYYEVFGKFKKESFFRISEGNHVNKLTGWKHILPKLQPVTDIVISDPYILHYSKVYPLKENYYKFLITIKESYSQIENILIFTYRDNDLDRPKEERYTSVIHDILKNSKKILGSKINFRIINFFKGASEHDRHVFMNYHHIKFGSSLNAIFDKAGALNSESRSTIRIQSYFNPDNYHEALLVLEYLEKYSSKINNGKENKSGLVKNTISKLFNFEKNKRIEIAL